MCRNFEIEKLSGNDISLAQDLLINAQLAHSDLIASRVKLFGIFKNTDLVTVGGFELFPDCAFLRSIAVHPQWQKLGLGRRMTRHLENTLKNKKIQHLYLLTFSAQHFFEKLDWEIINRDDVPQSIRQTTQFSGLCPVSAIAMHKKI